MADFDQATLELKSKGNEYFKAKQYTEAVEQYSQALLLNLNFFDCYSNRAACFINLQQYDKALQDGEKCISIDRNVVKGYWRKGDALQGLRRYDDAISAYSQGSKHASEAEKAQLQAAIDRCSRLKAPPTPRAAQPATRSFLLDSTVPLHLAVLGTAIVGVLPTEISYEAFYWCLKFSILLNLFLLMHAVSEQQHFPHFQPEGPGLLAKAKVIGMIIVMSNEFHYVTTAALFLTSRPFFFCNLPQAIRSVKAISQFFLRVMPSTLGKVATKVKCLFSFSSSFVRIQDTKILVHSQKSRRRSVSSGAAARPGRLLCLHGGADRLHAGPGAAAAEPQLPGVPHVLAVHASPLHDGSAKALQQQSARESLWGREAAIRRGVLACPLPWLCPARVWQAASILRKDGGPCPSERTKMLDHVKYKTGRWEKERKEKRRKEKKDEEREKETVLTMHTPALVSCFDAYWAQGHACEGSNQKE